MFKIRDEQMGLLSRAIEEDFLRRMTGHLRSRFGAELAARGLRDDELDPLARHGLASARSHGIVTEPDVRRYLECMVVLGPDFDRSAAWAGRILRRDDLDGARKMDAILDELPFAEGRA